MTPWLGSHLGFKTKGVKLPYRKKGTPQDESKRLFALVDEVARSRGGEALYEFIESTMTSIQFRCDSGHLFSKTVRAVLTRGGWCDLCRLGAPASQLQAEAAAHSAGYKLESEYKGLVEKARIRCLTCNQVFERSFRRAISNPCQHRVRSAEAANVRLMSAVSSLGGEVLSKGVTRLSSMHRFRCRELHEFELSGQSVVYRGSWCPECGDDWVTPDKVKLLVRSRGGELIGDIPKSLTGKTLISIRCNQGHAFENSWTRMSTKRGAWCQVCSKGSKSEEVARATFKQLFGGDFKKRRPSWLRNSRGRQMELDGYEESLGIAFEYQGRQHFEDVGIYRMGDKLDQRKADDELKRILCRENGIHLVELRWDDDYEDFPYLIRERLGESAERFLVDWEQEIDLAGAFIKDDRLEELRQVLATKNLELLSKKWIDVGYKYRIKCLTCQTEFNQQARSYLNSRAVAGCKRCAMKITADLVAKRKLGITKLQKIALEYGGSLVSAEYSDVKATYEWVCSAGHPVRRTIESIERSGCLCLTCKANRPDFEELMSFAMRQRGRLNSKEVTTSSKRYEWLCSLGHEFRLSWTEVQARTTFCPKCERDAVTLSDMRDFALRHSGLLVSEVPNLVTEISEWSCYRGHHFFRAFGDMKYKDSFYCRSCRAE